MRAPAGRAGDLTGKRGGEPRRRRTSNHRHASGETAPPRRRDSLDAGGDAEGDALLARLRERAGTGYHAASGLPATLAALQAGSVEALLLADDQALRGGRCTRCGFLFARPPAACPYDGAPVEGGVPVVEEALRLARAQGARTRLLSGEQAREFAGAGALLRF